MIDKIAMALAMIYTSKRARNVFMALLYVIVTVVIILVTYWVWRWWVNLLLG